MKVRNSPHFVPAEFVPVVGFWTAVYEVFETLRAKQAGGFLLADALGPKFYGKSVDLQAAVAAMAESKGWDALRRASVREVFSLTLVDYGWSPGRGILVPVGREIVAPQVEDSTLGDLKNRPDTVFPVMNEFGSLEGWYLNHESLGHSFDFGPARYRCQDGHITSNPNGNQCPDFDIKGKPCRKPLSPISVP